MSDVKELLAEYSVIIENIAVKLNTHSYAFFDDKTSNHWCDNGGEISYIYEDEVYSIETYGSASEIDNYIFFMTNHGDRIHIFDKNNKCDSEDERFI